MDEVDKIIWRKNNKSYKQGIHNEFDRDVVGMGIFCQGSCGDERQVKALSIFATVWIAKINKIYQVPARLAIHMKFSQTLPRVSKQRKLNPKINILYVRKSILFLFLPFEAYSD